MNLLPPWFPQRCISVPFLRSTTSRGAGCSRSGTPWGRYVKIPQHSLRPVVHVSALELNERGFGVLSAVLDQGLVDEAYTVYLQDLGAVPIGQVACRLTAASYRESLLL